MTPWIYDSTYIEELQKENTELRKAIKDAYNFLWDYPAQPVTASEILKKALEGKGEGSG
jgi:hypothetical protein